MKADYFSGVADSYSRFRPNYPPVLFDYLFGLCRRRRLAWDCATGNGQAATALTAGFDAVLATDLSAEQIARAACRRAVHYAVASAESPPVAESAVDLVTVAQALHWFDLGRFYAAVDRVLADDGVLAVWCYQLLRIDAVVDAVVRRYYHDVVGSYWPPQRALVEDGYRSLPFPYREIGCPEMTMTHEWSLAQLFGYLGSWSASQRYREIRGDEPLKSIGAALERAWGDPAASRIVRCPVVMRVGRRPPRAPT